jgi:hypothetical protein
VGFLVRRRYRSSIAGQRTPRPLDECASNARSARGGGGAWERLRRIPSTFPWTSASIPRCSKPSRRFRAGNFTKVRNISQGTSASSDPATPRAFSPPGASSLGASERGARPIGTRGTACQARRSPARCGWSTALDEHSPSSGLPGDEGCDEATGIEAEAGTTML